MITILLWALVIALYTPVLSHLYLVRWEMLDYSHAFFILPAALFIVWLKRQPIRVIATQNQVQNNSLRSFPNLSLMLLALGLFLFVFGWRHDYIFISSFSLIPLLVGIIGFLYGLSMLKLLAFPLAYLLFMIPPPVGILDAITLPMRHLASTGAAFILGSFHIPIERQGLLLYINHHEIFMAPACSGFRSLITFLALSVLYVYFLKTSFKKKLILLLSVIPLALLGNLIRVIILCLITYLLGDDMGQGFLHTFSGIVVFVVIISGFMLIDKLYKDDQEED